MLDNVCNNFCMPPYIDNDDQLTIRTYQEIFYRLERVALNAVEWKNLPEGLDPMIIERYLFYFGNVVLYYDEILMQYVALPMRGEFAWDVNAYPTVYDVVGFGGYTRRLTVDNSVIIWNNYQLNPTAEMAGLLATRLTNTLRTGDQHLELQKLGKILCVPENKRSGLKEIIRKIKNFAAYIIASPAAKELGESVTALDTELDYIVDKLDNHYSFLWHDALAYFGITSMSDKKSGVNIMESKSEDAMANANRGPMIHARRDGVKKFNQMFGENVSVDFSTEGGEEDGELYDISQDTYGESDREDTTDNV